MDGWMDGWVDGWTEGWMEGGVQGCMEDDDGNTHGDDDADDDDHGDEHGDDDNLDAAANDDGGVVVAVRMACCDIGSATSTLHTAAAWMEKRNARKRRAPDRGAFHLKLGFGLISGSP